MVYCRDKTGVKHCIGRGASKGYGGLDLYGAYWLHSNNFILFLLMPCSIHIGISTIPALAHSSDQLEASESIAMGICKLQRSTFPVLLHRG